MLQLPDDINSVAIWFHPLKETFVHSFATIIAVLFSFQLVASAGHSLGSEAFGNKKLRADSEIPVFGDAKNLDSYEYFSKKYLSANSTEQLEARAEKLRREIQQDSNAGKDSSEIAKKRQELARYELELGKRLRWRSDERLRKTQERMRQIKLKIKSLQPPQDIRTI